MMNTGDHTSSPASIQRVQRFGRLLSGMIMPNIGAFLAWGLLTALFIPRGWLPNATLAQLLQPMIHYLLPLLIGFTGGKLVYGHRGGVVGAVVTMGAIVGTSSPMIFGAMLAGPLAGWIIKKIDALVNKHIPAGFEMLVNNFASGILGAFLAICAFVAIGPVVEYVGDRAALLVENVVHAGFAPLASLVIEPAKVLFLNNVVNHGVLSPLGFQQAAQTGASLLFLLETNPGPGLGVLLAYFFFTKGTARQSAPGAMLIHFVGGIHEVYFPYILMQPKLLLAVIVGGAAGVFTFSSLDAGLVAVPSPGSVMSLMAMAPKGGLLPVLAGVFVSTLISFAVSSVLIDRKAFGKEDALAHARDQVQALKGKHIPIGHDCIPDECKETAKIRLIAVACDAGMGSSVMGASKLKTVFNEVGVQTKVISCPIEQLNESVDLVITHEQLTDRAVDKLPDAVHIAVADFINCPVYRELAERIANEKGQASQAAQNNEQGDYPVLKKAHIALGLESTSKEAAIQLAGKLLLQGGYIEAAYIDGMLERERECSTYIGNGAAIPHGTSETKQYIKRTGMSILQFPQGVDFNGNTAHIVVGIAALGDQHLKVLAELASIMEDEAQMEWLRKSNDVDAVFAVFTGESKSQSDIIATSSI